MLGLCGSGIQTGHRAGGSSLLHDVWVLRWKTYERLRAGIILPPFLPHTFSDQCYNKCRSGGSPGSSLCVSPSDFSTWARLHFHSMVAGLGYKIKWPWGTEPGESSITFYDFRTISVPFCWLEVSLSLCPQQRQRKRLQFQRRTVKITL